MMERTLQPRATTPGYDDIDPVELQRYPHARVVDVRESDEFEGGLCHIAGAELVPLQEFSRRFAAWDRDRAIVLVCRSGRRSGMAAAQLVAEGFHHVFNLRGGMLAYRDAGLPVRCGPCPR